MDFRLPNLGEGIDSGTVSRVLVQPGDSVNPEQNVLVVETDKASMEVPIDTHAKIEQILVKPGDKVAVGAPIFKLSHTNGASAPVAPAPASVAPAAAVPAAAPAPASVASGPTDYRLPSLGEGIDAGTVSRVLIQPGDTVEADQPVLLVETDKASMEVPITLAGKIQSVLVKPGDKIAVGTVILSVLASSPAVTAASAPASPPVPAASPASTATVATAATAAAVASQTTMPTSTAVVLPPKSPVIVPAGPATRRLARELGISLADVSGSGRAGRVTLEDVKTYVRSRLTAQPGSTAVTTKHSGSIVDVFTHPPLPDFGKYGPIDKQAVSPIRKKIAENLTISARMIPRVTQNDIADITELEAGRKRIVEGLPKGAPKVTWTVLAVKAVVAALKEFPHFNSSFDMNSGELILKKYYHIGIAVDTERGLVVPVIRNADQKSIRDIAVDVATVAEKARAGKLTPDEMRGGTFTITNLGGIGGTSFTPIVNYPEVAILGLSKSTLQPVVREGQIVPRLLMPMSLTYDHRVIDGADGARFTTRLVQLFSDPIRLLMES